MILEGYAFGKPVVATRVVGTVDYIYHGETGLFCEPYDPLGMREAIQKLIADPQERDRPALNALGLVEREHSFSMYVNQLLDVMCNVVAV